MLTGKHSQEKNAAESESLRPPPCIRESTNARSYSAQHAVLLWIQMPRVAPVLSGVFNERNPRLARV
jgi:hypothetical protein